MGMYATLFRNLVFPVIEAQQGTEIRKYLKWFNRTQWLKPEELEKLQNKKLRALIQHAYRNVPYYHRIFKKLELRPDDIQNKDDLSKLPILTKEDIRKNLDQLRAVNVPKSRVIEAHSSGSTGEPLKYYIDKKSYSSGWAQTFRCWGWTGFNLGDPYVKISLNPRVGFRKKLQDVLLNCKYIYFADVNEKTLKMHLETMRKGKIIRSYASAMYVISKLIEEQGMGDLPKPLAIMTTGDTLFPHYRELIESVFGCEVFDGYGGESTPIAFECEEHTGYHICDESIAVEFVKDGQEASPGELGSIVFTSLDNYAMPFIRYKINDVGVKADGLCSCGRGLSLMSSIEGRNTDLVVTPSGKFLVVQFFTTLFKYLEGVDQFQVVQNRVDRLNIKIVRNEKFRDRDEEYIISRIKSQVGNEMEISIEFVDSIPPTKSGKRRFVISNVTPF
ncbi:phenylacetate--CoA ligase family protein [Archaeoglobus sp.]